MTLRAADITQNRYGAQEFRRQSARILIYSATCNSCLSNCLGEESAVDPQVHASHEAARFFAGQEDDGAG
jgi:hypothetical protein